MRGDYDSAFQPLIRTFRLAVPPVGAGGAALCVYYQGRPVVDVALGTRNRQGDPFEQDTLALGLSVTKGVTATLLHVLVDRGVIGYDVPVAEYWPEFAQAGKQAITVRHVAAHQAGLYPVAPLVLRAEELFDWEAMTRAIARAKPVHAPGESFGYHAWTFGWIVGELIQRATGEDFRDLLRRYLAEPLGLDGLYIGAPESVLSRVAQVLFPTSLLAHSDRLPRFSGWRTLARIYRALGLDVRPHEGLAALLPPSAGDLDFADPRLFTSLLPSVNGVFSARSLARLFAALAAGGELGGVRLMSGDTLREATREHNQGVGRVVPFPMRIKLGYHRPISLGGTIRLGAHSVSLGAPNPDAFGHLGFGGSGVWADPARELAVGLITNCASGWLPLDTRSIAVSTVAGACVDALRRRGARDGVTRGVR